MLLLLLLLILLLLLLILLLLLMWIPELLLLLWRCSSCKLRLLDSKRRSDVDHPLWRWDKDRLAPQHDLRARSDRDPLSPNTKPPNRLGQVHRAVNTDKRRLPARGLNEDINIWGLLLHRRSSWLLLLRMLLWRQPKRNPLLLPKRRGPLLWRALQLLLLRMERLWILWQGAWWWRLLLLRVAERGRCGEGVAVLWRRSGRSWGALSGTAAVTGSGGRHNATSTFNRVTIFVKHLYFLDLRVQLSFDSGDHLLFVGVRQGTRALVAGYH